MSRVAVVTGGNKGIGFAIVKQLAASPGIDVILTARDPKLGQSALDQLHAENTKNVSFHQLDITDKASIDNLANYLQSKYGGLDILVNNAGMAFKGDAFDRNVAETTLKTNYYGTRDVLVKLLPLVKENGRVVNVSSTAGRLSNLSESLQKQFTDPALTVEGINALAQQFVEAVDDNTYAKKGWPKSCYGISKVAVTALTRVLGRDPAYHKKNILINACCPGWVRTDMAGPKATLSTDEGAVTPVKLALLPKEETKTGLFWREQQVVVW